MTNIIRLVAKTEDTPVLISARFFPHISIQFFSSLQDYLNTAQTQWVCKSPRLQFLECMHHLSHLFLVAIAVGTVNVSESFFDSKPAYLLIYLSQILFMSIYMKTLFQGWIFLAPYGIAHLLLAAVVPGAEPHQRHLGAGEQLDVPQQVS